MKMCFKIVLFLIVLVKLNTGVSLGRVIRDVNDTAPSDLTPHLQKKVPATYGFNRLQLGVNRQFLKNVCRDRNIGGIRHSDDPVSVDIQLREFTERTGIDPILFGSPSSAPDSPK